MSTKSIETYHIPHMVIKIGEKEWSYTILGFKSATVKITVPCGETVSMSYSEFETLIEAGEKFMKQVKKEYKNETFQ